MIFWPQSVFYLPPPRALNYLVNEQFKGPTLVLQVWQRLPLLEKFWVPPIVFITVALFGRHRAACNRWCSCGIVHQRH